MSTTDKRPVYVTILSALAVIQGVVAIALGVFVILDRNDEEFLRHINETDGLENHQLTPNLLLVLGIVGIVVGLVSFGLAFLLSNGSKIAQFVLGLVCIVNAALGLHSLVALHGEQQMNGSITLGVSLFTLWLLFGYQDSREFFAD